MATLQKFKLLATQCAVTGSPTRSPTTSPVIHLRRRKTLRMLLRRPDRDQFRRAEGFSELDDMAEDPPEKAGAKEVHVRHKLKDLFVSSPPLEDNVSGKTFGEERQSLLQESRSNGFTGRFRTVSAARRGLRPVTAAFRYRLLRRAWRPMLVTIPE